MQDTKKVWETRLEENVIVLETRMQENKEYYEVLLKNKRLKTQCLL